MLWLLPLTAVLGGVAIWVVGARARTHRLLAPAAAAVTSLTLAIATVAAAGEWQASFSWGPALRLTVAASGFARVMAVLVPAISVPVVLYATAAEADDRALAKLIGLLVAFVGAMELLVVAADLLTLLIGWELVGVMSWALIGHDWRDPERPARAAHAFVTTRFGDVGLYLAAGAAYLGGRSLSYGALATLDRPRLDVVAAGLLLAAAAKSAQLPFAPWLFSAMAGPTPVSALLHSATMVAAGAYALIRLAPAFSALGWFAPTVATIGVATAIAGGAVAFVQHDFKKSLAASTSAQYGLMFVAIGAGSVAAAGGHLVTQAAFKALLFLGAGIAIHAAGSGRLADMRLGTALRSVAVPVAIGMAALAAVPPLGGAFTKEAILAAAVEYGGWAGAAVVVAGFLSALYAARMHLLAYGSGAGPDSAPRPVRRRPGRVEIGAIAALAAATLALSALWLPGGRSLVERLGGSRLAEAGSWELPVSLVTIAAAFALVWGLDRRGRLAELGLPARAHAAVEDWFGVPALARRGVVEPVLALARALAAIDDRVIDAGVRATAALARAGSRTLSWWAERGIDGAVWGTAGAVLATARGSRHVDERGVDATVEGVATVVGRAGTQSRRLQTGLSHHYYLILAGVVVAVLAVATVWR